MINTSNTEQQTPAAEARALRLNNTADDATQLEHHLEQHVNKNDLSLVQQQPEQQPLAVQENTVAVVLESRQLTITLPWSFFASLLATIILCLHYSYFGPPSDS
eukprot:270078-Amphidinium_carterae.2